VDFVVLETKRLRLRPFSVADAPVVQRLAGARAIADTTLNVPHPYLDGMAEAWIATHAPNLAKGSGLTLAITSRDNDVLVGAIGLQSIVAGHRAKLGYWIACEHWGHGYCTEAGLAVLHHAFETLGLRRVHSVHLSRT
jgi:RimJ/RimL family protein N-acetyltransferase